MVDIKEEARRLRRRVEPVLAHALLRDDASAIGACRRFLSLYADPNYSLFNVGALLKQRGAALADDRHQWCPGPIREEHVGDPETMMICLASLVRAIALEGDAVLVMETFEEPGNTGACPCIALGLDGPGRVPDQVDMDGCFRLSFEELGERWTLASSGGRLDCTENGAVFRVKGMRMPPEPLPEAGDWIALLGRAPVRKDLEKLLTRLEGPASVSPGDLKAVLREALAEMKDPLAVLGVEVETLIDPGLPPIPMVRGRMRRFFDFVLDYALWAGMRHGALVFMAEYDVASREAGMVITLTARKHAFTRTCHLAGMERAIVTQGGRFEADLGEGEAVFTIGLPDTVGAALDDWLPGWPAFSECSRRMLRLLKSGGGPPEDFILGGVLEEELEAWLLPRLATPAARHVASEMEATDGGLPGSNRDRLKKALGQVAKGKVKKEICQPQYAGELFWAFRGEDRRRWAVGTDQVDETTVRPLCEALLAKPPDALEALKLMARIHEAEGG